MVTGGRNSSAAYSRLASTEVLVVGQDQWVTSTPLPSPTNGLSGATLSNQIIVAGKLCNVDIIRYRQSLSNCLNCVVIEVLIF